MARFSELARRKKCQPQTPEQVRACAQVRAVFGWTPDSIRPLAPDARGHVYAVLVRGDWEDSLEFICAEGLLIGIPPGGAKH